MPNIPFIFPLNPPLIHPKSEYPTQIIQHDSYGKYYALIPSGVRNFANSPDGARLTFTYRRASQNRTLLPRIRMSKKDRIRIRRAEDRESSEEQDLIC